VGHVVAVVGLAREAAVLRGLDVVAIAGGGASERLANELTEAVRGADGVISFGMAGALDPGLRIGAWVIGERVIGARVGSHPCDPAWTAALAQRLPQAHLGPVHADGRLIADPAEKARLNRTSACLAADMESHIAAAAAARAKLPFAILRCISDEAETALPPAIAVAMKPGGGLALGAILGSLLAHPGQLPHLLRTTSAFNRAYGELRRGAIQAGPRLALRTPPPTRDNDST
jgi:hopanoid-associated phosphorylase